MRDALWQTALVMVGIALIGFVTASVWTLGGVR